MGNSALLLVTVVLLHGACASAQWTACDTLKLSRSLNAYHTKCAAMQEVEQRTTIISYRDLKDNKPSETTTTRSWKYGPRMRSEHLGMVSLEDGTTRVTVDTEEHLIFVGKPESTEQYDRAWMRAAILREATSVRCATGSEGEQYLINYPKAAQYGQVELSFDAAGWLRRIELIWGRPLPVDPDMPLSALVTPKVVIAMEPPIKPSKRVVTDPASAYKRSGDKLVGVGEFAGYKVFDSRVQ